MPLWVQILIAGLPAVLSFIAASISIQSANKARTAEQEATRMRALEERSAEKKYEMYKPFLQNFGDALTPGKTEKALEEMEETIANFQSFVTVWGSDEVVKAYFRFRTASPLDPPPLVTMRLMSDLMVAIRRDIAWPETGLSGVHIIGMRINDLHNQPQFLSAFEKPLRDVFKEQKWEPPAVTGWFD